MTQLLCNLQPHNSNKISFKCISPKHFIGEKEGRKERKNYFMTHSTHFIYCKNGIRHMVKDHCLYAPSHNQDSIYHSFGYSSHGTLVETINSSIGPPWRIDPKTPLHHELVLYHGATEKEEEYWHTKMLYLMHWGFVPFFSLGVIIIIFTCLRTKGILVPAPTQSKLLLF